MQLRDEELRIVWAAMVAMTIDNHSPQDSLTEQEWRQAENMTAELNSMMDKKTLATLEPRKKK